jgi:anti-sigma factor RsiW
MEVMSDQHVRELNLRQLRAGELKESEAQPVQAHLAECARCRTQYKELEHEQHQFEQQISFDRFAAGVERALRTAQAPRPKRWLVPAMGMAAAVMVGIVVAPSLKRGSVDSGTRLKGGPDVAALPRVRNAPFPRALPRRSAPASAFGLDTNREHIDF